nr:unnamed protein product [Callosobruchus analis]
MKSKLDKCVIKIWALCDSSNTYCWNLQVYTGKRVVLDLVDGLGSGYGVTTDNFFTSLLSSKKPLQHSKTLPDIIRKVRREIPKQFIPEKKRPEHPSEILYTKDAILVSYVPKKNRSVLLLGTHSDLNISNEETAYKPQTILDYNKHKGAAESFRWKIYFKVRQM